MPPRFIKDIERCPYVPFDSEYDEWCRKDKERLQKLDEQYKLILSTAQHYKNNRKPNLRLMCMFVIEMLDRE